jgi:hypothetical protein
MRFCPWQLRYKKTSVCQTATLSGGAAWQHLALSTEALAGDRKNRSYEVGPSAVPFKEGQTLIERLSHEGIEVTAAAWVKESESGDWYLYLATPLVREDRATKAAYGRVNAVLREMEKEGFGMDPFAKKLIYPPPPASAGGGRNRAACGKSQAVLRMRSFWPFSPRWGSEANLDHPGQGGT